MRTWLAILLLLAATVPAAALSMDGGACTLESPSRVNPGDTGVTFRFYVYNGSIDAEWTAHVIFTFPDCFTVTGGWYDDGGLGWVFAVHLAGTVIGFDDDDGGHGEIHDGEGGLFYVTVDVGPDCPAGQALVHWFQQGDIWGGEPHYVEGDLVFDIGGTGAADSSFSRVKALY